MMRMFRAMTKETGDRIPQGGDLDFAANFVDDGVHGGTVTQRRQFWSVRSRGRRSMG
jgi:hypothetical protein